MKLPEKLTRENLEHLMLARSLRVLNEIIAAQNDKGIQHVRMAKCFGESTKQRLRRYVVDVFRATRGIHPAIPNHDRIDLIKTVIRIKTDRIARKAYELYWETLARTN